LLFHLTFLREEVRRVSAFPELASQAINLSSLAFPAVSMDVITMMSCRRCQMQENRPSSNILWGIRIARGSQNASWIDRSSS
jgi:hypothetical protein